jgi:hypothetical protein
LPDISTIDGTDITLLSNFQGVALTSGSLINGQTVSLLDTYDEIYSVDLSSLGASSLTIDNTILTTNYKTYDIFISGVYSNDSFRFNVGNSGSVYWSDTAGAFSSATSSGTEMLQSVVISNYGYTSARITLYDPANPNNDSRFDAESHQVWPSGISTASYIKIMSGRLSTTNAATGITLSSYFNFYSGNLTVYGIA